MNPVDRACLYTFIFILGVFTGAVISAIKEGIEKSVYSFTMKKMIIKDLNGKLTSDGMILFSEGEDEEEEEK